MPLSKLLHVGSVVAGGAAAVTAIAGVVAGDGGIVWGLSREHLFLCSGLLFLGAIWVGLGAIHHIMLEDRGRIL